MLPGAEEAVFFDGVSARRQGVVVEPTSDGRALRFGREVWALDRLRRIEGEGLVLALLTGEGDELPHDPARLVLEDGPLAAWVRGAAPALERRDLRRGTWGKIGLRVALAGAALALILFVFLPRISDMLADQMPLEQEVAFGDAVVRQVQGWLGGDGVAICKASAGAAALEKMERRLTEGQGLTYDIELSVMDHEMLNAFAAPGGRIVILRGLLDEAETAEEVAGVLAHEIGHVEARDPVRLAFRSAGSAGILALVLGDVTGGTVIGLLGDHLISASYTREAEAAADAFAFDLLQRTRIGTEGLADFFERIEGMGGDLPEILSTHPASGNRAEAARSAGGDAAEPVLTAAEWKALRGICGKG
jgi:Zn-dependent protease with chaperone function